MLRASLLSLTLLAGCGFGECPAIAPTTLDSGTYQSADNPAEPLRPFAGIDKKTVVVDRQAGTVKVSYTLNGKAYVEEWRIKTVNRASY